MTLNKRPQKGMKTADNHQIPQTYTNGDDKKSSDVSKQPDNELFSHLIFARLAFKLVIKLTITFICKMYLKDEMTSELLSEFIEYVAIEATNHLAKTKRKKISENKQ